jgi:putative transposase
VGSQPTTSFFFLNLESRRITLAGITRHPTEAWMTQMARNAVDDTPGGLRQCHYVLHDRDTKFRAADVLASDGIQCLRLPPRSPNLNAFAKRWVRSVKEECLSKLILIGERSLQRALTEFIGNFHSERNHQGKGNVLLFPVPVAATRARTVHCRERLGGLLRYYCRAA